MLLTAAALAVGAFPFRGRHPCWGRIESVAGSDGCGMPNVPSFVSAEADLAVRRVSVNLEIDDRAHPRNGEESQLAHVLATTRLSHFLGSSGANGWARLRRSVGGVGEALGRKRKESGDQIVHPHSLNYHRLAPLFP